MLTEFLWHIAFHIFPKSVSLSSQYEDSQYISAPHHKRNLNFITSLLGEGFIAEKSMLSPTRDWIVHVHVFLVFKCKQWQDSVSKWGVKNTHKVRAYAKPEVKQSLGYWLIWSQVNPVSESWRTTSPTVCCGVRTRDRTERERKPFRGNIWRKPTPDIQKAALSHRDAARGRCLSPNNRPNKTRKLLVITPQQSSVENSASTFPTWRWTVHHLRW